MNGTTRPPALRVSGLSLERDGARVLEDVSFSLDPGTITAVVGPNGSGKTTLLHCITSVIREWSGRIELGGSSLAQLPAKQRADAAALVSQLTEHAPSITSFEVAMLGRLPALGWLGIPGDADRRIAHSSLSSARALELADRLFSTLSGGEQQRVLLAKALAQRSALLVLDEPTNHLDIRAQLDVFALLKELASSGVTVLMSLHDLNSAAGVAHQLLVLKSGVLDAQGPPQRVLAPELISRVFDVDAEVALHPRSGVPIVIFESGAVAGPKGLLGAEREEVFGRRAHDGAGTG